MKQILILVNLLYFVNFIQGQNWMPIKVGEKYHYISDTFSTSVHTFSLLPTSNAVIHDLNNGIGNGNIDNAFSISIDSAINIGGDVHYKYVNRVIPCDTCSNFVLKEITPIDSSYSYPKIIQKSSGGHYLIFIADTIELASNPLTTSIINSSQQFHTYVDSIYWEPVIFGTIQDSIASITVVSTVAPYPILYKIYLSKYHGIVKSIRYDAISQNAELLFEMIGKEGQSDEGFSSLKFQDIYDFSVGDQFYYKKQLFDGTGGVWWSGYNIEYSYRIKILNRVNISLDSILYTVEKVHYQRNYPIVILNVADTFDIVYTHSKDSLYTIQQSEIRNSNPITYYFGFVTCKDFFFMNNFKYIGYDFGLTPLQAGPQDYISTFDSTGMPAGSYYGIGGPLYGLALLYGRGLGIVYNGSWLLEHTDVTELIGYVKGSDTVGVTPVVTILNIEKQLTKDVVTIKILPNPVTDYLNVFYQSQKLGSELTFSVVDMQGRALQNYTTADVSDETYIVPVHDLVAGVYILEVRRNGQLLKSEQFVKR